MSVRTSSLQSLEEYLSMEASTHEKHEFFRGEVFAMGGASERHNLIVLNIGGELRQQLKSRPCRVYPSDLRVKVSATGLYTYPDVVVVCGEPKFEQPGDTLLNPSIVVEVLSDSSEGYDRGRKSEHYRTLTSLSDYLLVAQDRPMVEHYTRQDGQTWLLRAQTRVDGIVALASIQCELQMSEVYRNVEGLAVA